MGRSSDHAPRAAFDRTNCKYRKQICFLKITQINISILLYSLRDDFLAYSRFSDSRNGKITKRTRAKKGASYLPSSLSISFQVRSVFFSPLSLSLEQANDFQTFCAFLLLRGHCIWLDDENGLKIHSIVHHDFQDYVHTGPERSRPEPNRTGFCLHATVWNRSRGPFLQTSRSAFGPGKLQEKSQTLSSQSCSFHINKVSLHAKSHVHTLLCF